MKNLIKRIFSILLIAIMCLQVMSIFNVSKAADDQVYTVTNHGYYWGSIYKNLEFDDAKETKTLDDMVWSRFTNNIDKYISSNAVPRTANRNNVERVSVQFSKYENTYRHKYKIKSEKTSIERTTQQCKSKEQATSVYNTWMRSEKVSVGGKFYTTESDPVMSYNTGLAKWCVTVTYYKKTTTYSRWKNIYSASKDFRSLVGEEVYSRVADYSMEGFVRAYYPVTIKFKIKGSDDSQNPTPDPTPNPTPDPTPDPGNQPVDSNPGDKPTETIDNGSALQNAIAFVNQVYNINEANQYNQAVKDLVNKTKTASDIAASELTNVYMYNPVSVSEFAKSAFKRALAREISEEELKDITDRNLSYADIISIVLSNDEFKAICDKYGLEKGSYTATKFNQNTTEEKANNFIKKEYQAALERNPSDEELKAISERLVNGTSNASMVVSAIFESSEFKNKAMDDAQFVNTLAKTTIGKTLDEKTVSSYTERLSSGTTRNELVQELLRHTSFQILAKEYGLSLGSYSPRAITTTNDLASKFAQNVSKSILGENANAVESNTTSLVTGEKKAGDFIKMYVEGDNFKDRISKENMSDNDCVNAIFKATLQRSATSDELSQYAQEMKSNGKVAMLQKLVNTKEFATLCNKYYLAVKQYNFNSTENENAEKKEEFSYGAVLTKKPVKDAKGNTTYQIESVKFDTTRGVKGDVNGDGVANASDATLILMYTAAVGSKAEFTPPLTDELKYADVNEDGTINASDAALILVYSARIGAGNNITWNDVLNK
ncbi:MAG: DUF4214 domain-containing protein [Clostridia bacterium]|nr:DUF4214 domain-containing protein [Clostridia bacterium]